LAPPGGKGSNIFGAYEEEKKVVNTTNGNGTTNGSTNGSTNGTHKSPVKPELTAHQIAAHNKHHNQHGTNIFGSHEIDDRETAKQHKDNNTTAQPQLVAETIQPPAPQQAQQQAEPVQTKSKKRTGYNPITGQSYDVEDEEKEKEKHKSDSAKIAPVVEQQQQQQAGSNYHSSSRVLQPPGGRSTKLW
jgi:hypothetical protein